MPRTTLLTLVVALALTACVDTPRQRHPTTGQRPLGWVDVRLMTASAPVFVGVTSAWALHDGDGRLSGEAGTFPRQGKLSVRGTHAWLEGLDLGRLPLELRPRGTGHVRVGERHYRGLLRLELDTTGALRLVNRVEVEDYLKGVLPAEMPDRFGIEALQAQAVAARSYVLAEIADRGWVHPDTRSQVYGGVEAETFLATRAVNQTEGQVLTHQGRVITAWFHSTCGGGTQPARDVFPGAPEGVMDRPVACSDCRESSTYRWSRSLSAAEVCEIVGLPDDDLRSVEPARATFPGFPGRPVRLLVRSATGSVELGAAEFRSKCSAGRSMAEQLLSTRWQRSPRVLGGRLLIDGQGWGHGVGLCQWGASGYAQRGAGYRAILKRYYPGAELVRLS